MNCRGKMRKNDENIRRVENRVVQWNIGWGHSQKLDKLLKICDEKVPVICLNEGNFKVEFSVPGYVFYREAIRDKSLASIMVRVDLPQCKIPLDTVEGIYNVE